MKTETHEQCTVCFEVLDATDPTTITADILDQLQLLITKLNIKLIRNSPICDACLAKVKSACKFKTSYLDLQETFHDIKLEEDAYSEKPAVCEICKSIVSPSDTIPLFDPVTKINKLMLINHLSPELESKVNEDPQTCESCHKSMLNFCSITNLLSVFDQDIGDDSEMPSTTVKKEHLDIDSSLVSASSSKDISTIVKKEESPSEDEETEDKDCTEYEEFLTKNEELDLKMDCDEEQGDERKRTRIKKEAKRRSNIAIARNESNSSSTIKHTITKQKIVEFKMKLKNSLQKHIPKQNEDACDNKKIYKCNVCELTTNNKNYFKTHSLLHKKPDEVFRCEVCKYKTTDKYYIKRHMIVHKKNDEVKMLQCEICSFSTKYKQSLRTHKLSHRTIDDMEIFQCEICEYKTSSEEYIKKHMIKHQKSDEIEMFQCEKCNFVTECERFLTMHILTNHVTELYQCELCKLQLKSDNSLKEHIRIHDIKDEV